MAPLRYMANDIKELRELVERSIDYRADTVLNVNGREFARATLDDFEFEGRRRGNRIGGQTAFAR